MVSEDDLDENSWELVGPIEDAYYWIMLDSASWIIVRWDNGYFWPTADIYSPDDGAIDPNTVARVGPCLGTEPRI